ncbi:NRDE family protein [Nocardiopsis ansamitocini]|uniref:NRDE family protein n=1 Tax=Nocardiopsis ansamitocini TaxID=1670832 RepID=A0A9W6P894_9ACTN|nr:NRDE family protein [Nocardiopsis ansamitocini]GLU48879.1 hypothetical protein Nans01_32300 [Nocardiopsis ansamitocini]
MCTVIIGFDPASPVPLVVAALRDEMTDRPFESPGAHWPSSPGLLGGRDLLAGGTWLAVSTQGSPRVAAVLNGRLDTAHTAGRRPVLDRTVAPDIPRRSRGELPLLAARTGELGLSPDQLRAFDPFHLIIADSEAAALLSWDGTGLARQALAPGVTIVVNNGVDPAEPRAARNTPLFERTRPVPGATVLASAGSVGAVWGAWPGLLDGSVRDGARTAGTGSGTDDPAALITRVELMDGRVWATGSITLLACAPTALRYAFSDRPGDPTAWRMIR